MIIFEVSSSGICCYSIKVKLMFALKKKDDDRVRDQEADEEPISTALEEGELADRLEGGSINKRKQSECSRRQALHRKRGSCWLSGRD